MSEEEFFIHWDMTRYRLTEMLNESNHSTVYRAEDEQGNIRAVKLWDRNDDARSFGEMETLMCRLTREKNPDTTRFPKLIEATTDFTSIDLSDFQKKGRKVEEPGLITVFEYIAGPTVYDLINSRAGEPGLTDIGLALAAGIDVCRALSDLHKFHYEIDGKLEGFVHRDVKPKNIMMREDGNFTLIDLAGVGKRNVVYEFVYGTVEYCSSEHLRDFIGLHPRVDIYALGVTLYEMTTRWNPFSSERDDDEERFRRVFGFSVPKISAVNPRLKELACCEHIESIVEKAMDRDPEKRFLNADEFLDALLNAGAAVDRETGSIAGPELRAIYAREFIAVNEAERQQSMQVPESTSIPPLEFVNR